MSKKNFQDENAKLAAAVLRLAAAKGWARVTPEAALREAKVKRRTLTKKELAAVIVAQILRQALARACAFSGSPHDVLFDLMMARFDVLQENRKGVLAVASAARRDKELALSLARAVLKSMASMASAARQAGVGVPKPLLTAGLSALYGYAFWVWRRDESRDMAATMAAVDRIIQKAEGR